MTAPTSMNLDEHLGQAGPAAQSFARLWGKLWHQEYVSAELLELCRLTLARLHRDPLEMAAANPHSPSGDAAAKRRRAALSGLAHEDPAFSAAERAALQFAELYWMDAQSIDDEAADGVKAHFGEAGFVFLIEALGLIDGRIRTARCLRDLVAQS
jgi:hypothetical protein